MPLSKSTVEQRRARRLDLERRIKENASERTLIEARLRDIIAEGDELHAEYRSLPFRRPARDEEGKRLTLPDRIMPLVIAAGEAGIRTSLIRVQLPDVHPAVLSTTLSRMAADGRVRTETMGKGFVRERVVYARPYDLQQAALQKHETGS